MSSRIPGLIRQKKIAQLEIQGKFLFNTYSEHTIFFLKPLQRTEIQLMKIERRLCHSFIDFIITRVISSYSRYEMYV